jgi:hypothetical protein
MDATLAEMRKRAEADRQGFAQRHDAADHGSRSQRRREAGLVTGLLTHETPPSGRRTAHHDDGVRIITPREPPDHRHSRSSSQSLSARRRRAMSAGVTC